MPAGQGGAAVQPDAAQALAAVPSAAGGSVWARVTACGLQVQKTGTWTNLAFADNAQAGLKKGDLTVQVWAVFPKPLLGEIGLVWRIRQGKAMPDTGWADRLQNSKAIPELRC